MSIHDILPFTSSAMSSQNDKTAASHPKFTGLLNKTEVRNAQISPCDFSPSDFHKTLEKIPGYSRVIYLYHSFRNRAAQAYEEKNYKQAKIYELIGSLCHPSALCPNEEERVMFAENTDFLEAILPDIHDVAIKGYINDFLAIMYRGDRERVKAKINEAISNFLQLPFNKKVWLHSDEHCWERALELCRYCTKQERKEKLAALTSVLLEGFFSDEAERDTLHLRIAYFLERLNLPSRDEVRIANKLAELASRKETSMTPMSAEPYYTAALHWYKKAMGKEDVNSAISDASYRLANLLETHAAMFPSISAEDYYARAYELFNSIDNKEKEKRKVAERLERLKEKMITTARTTCEQFTLERVCEVDLSEQVKFTCMSITGKTLDETLHLFFKRIDSETEDSYLIYALESMPRDILNFVGKKVVHNSDCQVIHRSESIDDITKLNTQHPRVIEKGTEVFLEQAALEAYGHIKPACHILNNEHDFSQSKLFELMPQSPLYFPDRAKIIAMGIFYGFIGEYVAALHILIPQFEHAIRRILKNANINASNINTQKGVKEEDLAWGTLIERGKETLSSILGKDRLFKITAMLSEYPGKNYRNQIAHGRLSEIDCESPHGIYTWWLLSAIFLLPSPPNNEDDAEQT